MVTILKFSLFNACKSVHRAELFKQIMWFDLLRIMFFYFFLMISEKKLINNLEKCIFAKL